MTERRPAVARVVLVRHAETDQNAGGIVQGRADHPLSALGRRQAAALAAAFAERRVAAIYSSPLQRAFETASTIAAPHALKVVTLPALVEMDIGEMEGLTGAQLRERHPEFLRAWQSDGAASAVMPGGESLEQVQARAGPAIDEIMTAHAGETAVVVSHNFVILCLLCRFLSLPLKDFRRLRHHVAGASIIEGVDGRQVLVAMNDVSHLERAGLLGDDPWERRPRSA